MGVCVHPLADRDGLRLLLCFLRHPPEGGPQARGPLVPEESQRPRFQPNPGDDPSEHTQAHAQVGERRKKKKLQQQKIIWFLKCS